MNHGASKRVFKNGAWRLKPCTVTLGAMANLICLLHDNGLEPASLCVPLLAGGLCLLLPAPKISLSSLNVSASRNRHHGRVYARRTE